MKLEVKKGTTSFICHVFLQANDKTDGRGKTGLVYSDMTLYYMRAGASVAVAVTVGNITTLGTFAGSATGGAFKEVDATNMPGIYELHIPNNAIAAGVGQVAFLLQGSATTADLPIEIILKDNTEKDVYDRIGANGAGLTDLATAAALATHDGKLTTVDNVVDAIKAITDDWADGQRLDLILDIIAADTTTDIPALLNQIIGYVDTEVAAIKTVTDKLPDGGLLTSIAKDATVAKETTLAGVSTRIPAALVGGRMSSDMIAINQQTTDGNNASLYLKELNIQNEAGHAFTAKATAGNYHGMYLKGNGTGRGRFTEGGANGHGEEIVGGVSGGNGLYVRAQAADNNGAYFLGVGAGHGIDALAGATGHGIRARGGITSGDGLYVVAQTDGNGASFIKAGSGKDIDADIFNDLRDGGRLDLLIDAIKAKTDTLPETFKKNVAIANFAFFLVLKSDSKTGATGKAATISVEVQKDGGTFASVAGSVAEIGYGLYRVSLTQAEMNADLINLAITETDCDTRIITLYTNA